MKYAACPPRRVGRAAPRYSLGRGVGDALVAVDAGHLAARTARASADEFLLLGEHLRRELVADAAVARIVALVLGPHLLRHAQALLLEFLLGGDHAAHLADDVLDAGLRLVPEQLRIVLRDVAVVAAGAHAGAVRPVDAFACAPCATHCIEWQAPPQNSSVPVTTTITWVPIIATAPDDDPRTSSASTDQRALGLLRRRQVRVIKPGCIATPLPGSVQPQCSFPTRCGRLPKGTRARCLVRRSRGPRSRWRAAAVRVRGTALDEGANWGLRHAARYALHA